jgi:PiT family inorganic phosphate transporter
MVIENFYLIIAIVFSCMLSWGIGANDVSNAMGTAVGSKSVSIKQAIIIAAIFEFLGALLAGSEVTSTIREKIIILAVDEHPSVSFNEHIVAIGMLAAIVSAASWLIIASYRGWPVSTTHTIIGAIVGVGASQLGLQYIDFNYVGYIVFGWVISPILGAITAYAVFFSIQHFIFSKQKPLLAAKKSIIYYAFITIWVIAILTGSKLYHLDIDISFGENILYSAIISLLIAVIAQQYIKRLKFDPEADVHFHFTNVEKIFSILTIFTACAMAFAHGSNDVANAIGPAATVVDIVHTNHTSNTTIPMWLLMLGAGSIIVGLATYGYKVIATIGNNITELTPSRAFSVSLSTSAIVLLASSSGLPISTTHTLVGGILGIGFARGIHALNLNVIRSIIASWILTVPMGAILAIIFFYVIMHALEFFQLINLI